MLAWNNNGLKNDENDFADLTPEIKYMIAGKKYFFHYRKLQTIYRCGIYKVITLDLG